MCTEGSVVVGKCVICDKDVYNLGDNLPNNLDKASAVVLGIGSIYENAVLVKGFYGSTELDYGMATFCDPKYAEKAYQLYMSHAKDQTQLRACVCDDCIKEQKQKNTILTVFDSEYCKISVRTSFNSSDFNPSEKDDSIHQCTMKGTSNLTEDNLFVTIPRVAVALQYSTPEDINKIINTLEGMWCGYSNYRVAYSAVRNVISIYISNRHMEIRLGDVLVLYNMYDSLEVLTETEFKQKFMCRPHH